MTSTLSSPVFYISQVTSSLTRYHENLFGHWPHGGRIGPEDKDPWELDSGYRLVPVGGRPAVPLFSERRSFMTELEQQLTNALTALSKQYETEMEQQAEWVGELQEQVQRLEESVKDLKPQLGRTEALTEDLKQQVELLGVTPPLVKNCTLRTGKGCPPVNKL